MKKEAMCYECMNESKWCCELVMSSLSRTVNKRGDCTLQANQTTKYRLLMNDEGWGQQCKNTDEIFIWKSKESIKFG